MATYGTSNPSYKHGKSTTPEYKIWVDMRQRCENPNRTNFKHYGGRGIAVCERWQTFDSFISDMGERPSKKHSIERRNNEGDYSPDNCFWATIVQQRRNNRRNRHIEANGKRMLLCEWAKELNADERTIRQRIRNGWNPEQAVTIPIIRDGRGGKARFAS